MNKQSIGPFAKMMGTTVRTLRYYDKLGLLVPGVDDLGQKVYGSKEQKLFQKIQVCKYFGMSLEEIKKWMQKHSHSLQDQIITQKTILEKKRAELDKVIETMERAEVIKDGSEIDDLNEQLYFLVNVFRLEHAQMRVLSNYCTTDEIEALFKQVNQTNKLDADMETAKWYQQLHKLLKNNVSPNSEEAQKLAQAYMENVVQIQPSPEDIKIMENMLKNDGLANELEALNTQYIPSDIEQYSKQIMSSYMSKL